MGIYKTIGDIPEAVYIATLLCNYDDPDDTEDDEDEEEDDTDDDNDDEPESDMTGATEGDR